MLRNSIALFLTFFVFANFAFAEDEVRPHLFDDLNGNQISDRTENQVLDSSSSGIQPGDATPLVDMGETPPDEVSTPTTTLPTN